MPPHDRPAGTSIWSRRGRWPEPLVLSLFVLVPLAVGMGSGWELYRQEWRLRNYVPVRAEVLSTAVRERGAGGRDPRNWQPQVRYRYRVDGREYVGGQVTPTRRTSTYSWALRLSGRFHPGQTVTAYRHPAHPEQAFLVPMRRTALWWWTILPAALAAAIALRLRMTRPRHVRPRAVSSG